MLEKINRRLSKTSAVSSAFIVTLGTVVSQAVLLLVMPVVTRLYSPHEMGLYSVFVAATGVFAVTIALHYELAIPIPRSVGVAKSLLSLALWISLIGAFVVGGGIVVFRVAIFTLLDASGLIPYAWFAVPFLFLTGITTIFSAWAIRVRAFNVSAASKVCQGCLQSGGQLTLGFSHSSVLGLVLGQVIGLVGASLVLARAVPRGVGSGLLSLRYWIRLRAVALRYRDFPRYATLSSLINASSAHMPVMLLSVLFGAEVAGFFALGYRVLQIPLRLVGQSISQVFLSQAAELARDGGLGDATQRLLVFLWAIGLPLFAIGGVVAPSLFALMFGEPWRPAGIYAQYLMPWMLFLFISTILSVLVSVLERQREELRLNLVSLLITTGALLFGALADSPTISIVALGVGGAAFLLTKICWIVCIVQMNPWTLARRCLGESSLTVVFPAVTALVRSSGFNDAVVVGVGVVTGALVIGCICIRFRTHLRGRGVENERG